MACIRVSKTVKHIGIDFDSYYVIATLSGKQAHSEGQCR